MKKVKKHTVVVEAEIQEDDYNEAVRQSALVPSEFQEAIYNFGKTEKKNLLIQAVAGSGKSTTLFELAKTIGGSIVFLAFNKIIAEYAKGKMAGFRNVDCRTFHSLGMMLISKATGFFAELDQKGLGTSKLTAYFNNHQHFDRNKFGRNEFYPKFTARKVVKMIRQLGLLTYDVDGIEEFIRTTPGIFSVDPRKRAEEESWVYKNIQYFPGYLKDLDKLPVRPVKGKVLTYHNVIDFDDMVRLPCVHQLVVKYGITQKTALIDESQDMNAYQVDLVTQLFDLGVRTICCGDRLQGIYSFRGAYLDSMDRMKATTGASELPLSVTYRSRQTIVDFVNSQIEGSTMIAHKEGGEVITIQKETFTKQVLDNDVRMIVGAKNKSLIECWILLAKSKIASSLKGSRIVQELRDILEDLKPRDLDHLLMKIDESLDGATIIDADGEARYTLPQQQIDLMNAVPELIDSFNMTTLRDFENLLKEMEQDANREIHTVHSAKGLESEAVIVLCDWFPSEQLTNMQYVAYTRAESKLLLVSDWQKEKEREV